MYLAAGSRGLLSTRLEKRYLIFTCCLRNERKYVEGIRKMIHILWGGGISDSCQKEDSWRLREYISIDYVTAILLVLTFFQTTKFLSFSAFLLLLWVIVFVIKPLFWSLIRQCLRQSSIYEIKSYCFLSYKYYKSSHSRPSALRSK